MAPNSVAGGAFLCTLGGWIIAQATVGDALGRLGIGASSSSSSSTPPVTGPSLDSPASTGSATAAGVTITSTAQAQSILANPKSTAADKRSAASYLESGAGAAGN